MRDPRLDPYYRTLGLDPGASKDQIKKAYRKLAMIYHPDRNHDPGAKEHFIRLTEAYEILMHPPKQRRARADRTGSDPFEEQRRKEWEEARRKAREEAKSAARQRYKEFLRKRELEQAREYRKGIYILLVGFVIFGGYYFGNRFLDNILIERHKATTIGRVTLVDHHSVYIQYEYQGADFEDRHWVSKGATELYSGAGIPLFKGDEFQIELDSTDPSRHRINYHRVSLSTLSRAFKVVYPRAFMALNEKLIAVPEESRERVVRCIMDESLKEFGLEAWGDMYFSNEHFLDNLNYNSASWGQRLNNPRFEALLERCGVVSDGNP